MKTEIKFDVREAGPLDAPAIARLVNRAYRGEEGMRSWTTEASIIGGQRVDSDGVLEMIAPPRSTILLAEESGAVAQARALAGCVHVARHSSGDGYFGMLAVDPDHQKARLGATLIEAAEKWARRLHGASAMRLSVISIRHELVSYYERKGYHATGECTPFPYGDPRFGLPLVEGLVLATYRKLI